MKVDKEILKTNEIYTIEENDTLKIESKGKITEIFINDEKITLVTKIEFIQDIEKGPILKIERLFTKKDFEGIKDMYGGD